MYLYTYIYRHLAQLPGRLLMSQTRPPLGQAVQTLNAVLNPSSLVEPVPMSWPDTCPPTQRAETPHIFWVFVNNDENCLHSHYARSCCPARAALTLLKLSLNCGHSLACVCMCVCKVNVVSFVLLCSAPRSLDYLSRSHPLLGVERVWTPALHVSTGFIHRDRRGRRCHSSHPSRV